MGTFRTEYKVLSDEEKQLVSDIKTKAEELEALIKKTAAGRYASLAITELEAAVMWAVKHVTG